MIAYRFLAWNREAELKPTLSLHSYFSVFSLSSSPSPFEYNLLKLLFNNNDDDDNNNSNNKNNNNIVYYVCVCVCVERERL